MLVNHRDAARVTLLIVVAASATVDSGHVPPHHSLNGDLV